jgi:SAM-dependent methyltransferase
MHQPFCAASALQLPFASATFDLVWSIWTLEHVIDPVRMLTEMQRVTRPGGFLFLCAAWFVPDWATRDYGNGPWGARSIAPMILRYSTYPRRWLGWPYILLSRLWWLTRGELRELPYRFLLPNYTAYHAPDADACVHLEAAAVILWFRARGAVCVSHPNWWHILTARHDEPLIFQVV